MRLNTANGSGLPERSRIIFHNIYYATYRIISEDPQSLSNSRPCLPLRLIIERFVPRD